MAGAAVSANQDGAFEVVSRPQEETPAPPEPVREPPQPETSADDPFWNVNSIYDMLQQSESGEVKPRSRRQRAPEPVKLPEEPAHEESPEQPEKPAPRQRRTAPIETPDEVPSGIWTEDRELFSTEHESSTHEEIAMLKDKKRGKSNKTQRLFDAIMRESDDNPNFRKK